MRKILIGNTNQGWEVDDINKVLNIYQSANVIEQIKKRKICVEIYFSNIKNITVNYSISSTPYNEKQYFIKFNVYTNDENSYEFNAMMNGISRQIFKNAIMLLYDNSIIINDLYRILEKIINTEDAIWDILYETEKIKK